MNSNTGRNVNTELRELEKELNRKTLKRGVGSRNVITQGILKNWEAEEKKLKENMELAELNMMGGSGHKSGSRTTQYMSVQERFVNGVGQRNIVSIESNGTAVKRVEQFVNGKRIKQKTRKLTAQEKKDVMKGVFVPGLWKNCCLTKKTRGRKQK